VPHALQYEAVVPGMPGIRYRAPKVDGMIKDLRLTVQREQVALRADGYSGPLLPISFLAISGGGENGAFGAGLLVGWTEHGDRPEFNFVTGVSTGALIAPFAFLGPKYDAQLKRLYTEISAKDVLALRNLVGALFDDALADNLPLKQLVAANITQEVIDAIAAESRKGRLLLVATTDLDAQRSVYWNLTLMAESRHPAALELIRMILVASAAIPGELPPAMIDVEVGGQRYQEMHVDGGTTQQVFLLPPELVLTDVARRDRTVYVIRNSRLEVDSLEVKRDALAIAGRAVASLIQTQGVGNLYEIAAQARRDGAKFRLAFMPESFDKTLPEAFDRTYMNELFLVGYQMGVAGYPWATQPPGLARD
jgi:predicted acylesterase/phospholipase RssA